MPCHLKVCLFDLVLPGLVREDHLRLSGEIPPRHDAQHSVYARKAADQL
jgi:hypothetical protein